MVLHKLNALLIPHWNPYPLGVVNGKWAGNGEVSGDGRRVGWRIWLECKMKFKNKNK